MYWAILLSLMVWDGNATVAFVVEVNTYGDDPNARTVVIYRERDGRIIAWRWKTDGRHIPSIGVGGGWKVACWKEDKRLRTVLARHIVETRTGHDVEYAERWVAPRRGLR